MRSAIRPATHPEQVLAVAPQGRVRPDHYVNGSQSYAGLLGDGAAHVQRADDPRGTRRARQLTVWLGGIEPAGSPDSVAVSLQTLSWRLSNSLDSDFCAEALQEALARYGQAEIFNTDQGCQFTSQVFTDVLKQPGVRISMDGKGRWMDHVFIERLWRSLKYACVYLHELQDGPQARQLIGAWLKYYSEERPHSTLAQDRTPMEEYTRHRAAA